MLAGAAGPIPALCVLPSWADSAASTSALAAAGGGTKVGVGGSLTPRFHDLGMMAMSSWKNTFVVGIYPEVRVFIAVVVVWCAVVYVVLPMECTACPPLWV